MRFIDPVGLVARLPVGFIAYRSCVGPMSHIAPISLIAHDCRIVPIGAVACLRLVVPIRLVARIPVSTIAPICPIAHVRRIVPISPIACLRLIAPICPITHMRRIVPIGLIACVRPIDPISHVARLQVSLVARERLVAQASLITHVRLVANNSPVAPMSLVSPIPVSPVVAPVRLIFTPIRGIIAQIRVAQYHLEVPPATVVIKIVIAPHSPEKVHLGPVRLYFDLIALLEQLGEAHHCCAVSWLNDRGINERAVLLLVRGDHGHNLFFEKDFEHAHVRDANYCIAAHHLVVEGRSPPDPTITLKREADSEGVA
mmetsp:Transcript_1488/g.2518  ORF Transcript_1488/g.2518 Transcript_1488/m.2518 type:complete len:314 (-) Transcript_1488:522-1463(-)